MANDPADRAAAAMPGIMTGMILAMARGAGEVAPLMLVGAMKSGSRIADRRRVSVRSCRSAVSCTWDFTSTTSAFNSQNSEAARPMVFTTTLLLIAIIAALNITAILVAEPVAARRFGVSHSSDIGSSVIVSF